MTDEKNQQNANQIPPMSQMTPVLKSPVAEGWKAGLTSGLAWFAGMSTLSVILGKITGHGTVILPTRPPTTVHIQPPKVMQIIKDSFVSNALWGLMFGLNDASRAISNTAHENKENLLTHENAVLREQLGQAGEILNQTAAYMQMAGQPAASHAEKALADKAAHADAKSIA